MSGPWKRACKKSSPRENARAPRRSKKHRTAPRGNATRRVVPACIVLVDYCNSGGKWMGLTTVNTNKYVQAAKA